MNACIPEHFSKTTYQEYVKADPADKLGYALHGKFNGSTCIYGYTFDETDAKNVIETHKKLQKLIVAIKNIEGLFDGDSNVFHHWTEEIDNLFTILQECEKEG
jgi:hypothetical protein